MSRWVSVVLAASRPLAVVAVVLLGVGLVGAAATPVGGEATVLSDVAAARAPALTVVARVATTLGDLWLVTLVAVVVAVAVRRSASAHRIRAVLLLAIGGSTLIVGVLKVVVARQRPTGGLVATASAAYPSGHATRAAVICGLLVWAWYRIVRHRGRRAALVIVTVVVTAAIAASRVYLGVHLPSEALMGMLIGGVWTVAVLRVTAPDRAAGVPEDA